MRRYLAFLILGLDHLFSVLDAKNGYCKDWVQNPRFAAIATVLNGAADVRFPEMKHGHCLGKMGPRKIMRRLILFFLGYDPAHRYLIANAPQLLSERGRFADVFAVDAAQIDLESLALGPSLLNLAALLRLARNPAHSWRATSPVVCWQHDQSCFSA